MSSALLPTTLSAWLEYLEKLHPQGQSGIVLGLDRIRTVAEKLQHRPFCPVITVGGTNGKGSSCAYLENMLLQAHYRTGCYTSPHLLHYNERVRLNGKNVADEPLCKAFGRVEAARQTAGNIPLTYFEFGTLAAWEFFAQADVEAIILEVGLGGRLDATNLYDADVAIVTSVDLDHQEWLGTTREAIGHEKAGIFRANKPAICADPHPPQSLLDHAGAIGAKLVSIGADFGFRRDAENPLQWLYWHQHDSQIIRRSYAFPGLRGNVQLLNASAALTALDYLPLHVSMQARREGLIRTEIPGRFQLIPGRPAIVLDVGHNPQALRVLAENLKSMGFFEHTYAVVGMLADKDAQNALAALKGKVDHWFCADLAGPRASPAQRLADIVINEQLGGDASCHANPRSALIAAQEMAGENDRIAAFGSFLTVADVLIALHRI